VPAGPTTHSVRAELGVFNPASITIRAGDTIEWTNVTATTHTVTSGIRLAPTLLFGEVLNPGETVRYLFTNPGTYKYYCVPHFGMDGVVIVTD
jgi:plastocyanin